RPVPRPGRTPTLWGGDGRVPRTRATPERAGVGRGDHRRAYGACSEGACTGFAVVTPASGTAPHVPPEAPQVTRWMFLVAGQECSALFRIEQLTPGDSPAGTHDRCAHTGWGWCPACA